MDEKKRTDYKRAFNEKAYDRLAITIPKGRKQTIEALVKREGKTVNGLVNELLRKAAGLSEAEWKSPGEAAPEAVPVENAALEAVPEDSSDIPQKEPAVDVEAPPAVEAASVEPVANPLSKTKDSDSNT